MIYFASTAGGGGSELWRTDGTTAGTVRVKDIRPGSTGSSPDFGAVIGNKVILLPTTARMAASYGSPTEPKPARSSLVISRPTLVTLTPT
jgi:ELWxxDGT repeat protein